MSYCRFSSDDFQCDVYCYADCQGGYTTWVAGRKRKIAPDKLPPKIPLHKNMTKKEWKAFCDRDALVMEMLGKRRWHEITLPHAGECFNDPTLKLFKARLLYLRGLGYSVPDYALERIDEELAEEREKRRKKPSRHKKGGEHV